MHWDHPLQTEKVGWHCYPQLQLIKIKTKKKLHGIYYSEDIAWYLVEGGKAVLMYLKKTFLKSF